MGDSDRERRLTETLVTLADTLVVGYDVVELMHFLVDSAVELFDAAAAGLVLSDGYGALDVLASTTEDAELLEVLQIRTRTGPCIDCLTLGETQTVADIRMYEPKWPQFVPLALAQGFHSVHAVPMRLRDQTIGALNLFRTTTGELAERDRRAAQALADIATIGILQQRAAREAADLNGHLAAALGSRVVIEQAKGMLSEYGQLTMDAAFTGLRGFARRHQLPLTELATSLVQKKIKPQQILNSTESTISSPGPDQA